MSKYKIIWDDEHTTDSHGPYDTLEEAKHHLENACHDAEIEMACMDKLNIRFNWDDDRLGFEVVTWKGFYDDPQDYFERTYRIHETDDDGNIIDDN